MPTALRRQANTVVRLTVVTIFGPDRHDRDPASSAANLTAAADEPMPLRVALFVLTLVIAIGLTALYDREVRKRLADFLDARAVGFRASQLARRWLHALRRVALR